MCRLALQRGASAAVPHQPLLISLSPSEIGLHSIRRLFVSAHRMRLVAYQRIPKSTRSLSPISVNQSVRFPPTVAENRKHHNVDKKLADSVGSDRFPFHSWPGFFRRQSPLSTGMCWSTSVNQFVVIAQESDLTTMALLCGTVASRIRRLRPFHRPQFGTVPRLQFNAHQRFPTSTG